MISTVNAILRNFGKSDLMDLFKGIETDKRIGAEIGVFNGEFSEPLLRHMQDLTLYMIDPYKKFVKNIYDDVANQPQNIQNARYEMVKLIAELYGERAKLLRMTSMEALNEIDDNTLDFVFIDANHNHPHIDHDIWGWWKKLKLGGWLTGHDYYDMFPHVKEAVLYFCAYHDIESFRVGMIDGLWIVRKEKNDTKS